MIQAQFEIIMIAAVVAAACSLTGVYLVLRRMALMSDAISHSILLGIVVGFFLTRDLASPWLVTGAAITGVLTVALVEIITRTGKVRKDASIGLVFPALFSIGVILISRYAGDIHLDTDAVLVGELVFAPFDRLIVAGWDLGPRAMWLMSAILGVNLAFIALFYKELKISTFDAALAAALGFAPAVMHYALMALVSVTAVGAFDAVGSILVVALMIAPPAAAYMLTDRLSAMLGLSTLGGVLSAVLGYFLAHALDASIAGSMAVMSGVIFVAALMFAPQRGLVAKFLLKLRQRWEFTAQMLLVHLLNHEGTAAEHDECRIAHLGEHIGWDEDYAGNAVVHAVRARYVTVTDERLSLTELGRETAREALNRT